MSLVFGMQAYAIQETSTVTGFFHLLAAYVWSIGIGTVGTLGEVKLHFFCNK